MIRLTPRFSSRLLILSLLATTPLLAMDGSKGQKPKDGAKDSKSEKTGSKTAERFKALEESILGLKKHVEAKNQESHLTVREAHQTHSQEIAAIRADVGELARKVEASENEIGTIFARYDQTSRASIEQFREELAKCSEERFVRLEENSAAQRTAHAALSTRFDELRESLVRIEEIREANGGDDVGQPDGAAAEQLAAIREEIQRQITELTREVAQLKEALMHEESCSGNELDVPADGLKILEKVHTLIAEVEGKMDGLEELFDIGIKELKTNIDDLEVFYDNELIELHTRVKDLPSFEKQLQTLCVNHAQSLNHPIAALAPLGLYHGCNGNEWVAKLTGFINSNLETTIDPKPITALIKRTLCANILNALLPKTGLVSHAKNGWAYMATEWTYPLVSAYVPEQVADQVTNRYQQLPEFAQTGLPWLGKSLLAFAIAPGA